MKDEQLIQALQDSGSLSPNNASKFREKMLEEGAKRAVDAIEQDSISQAQSSTKEVPTTQPVVEQQTAPVIEQPKVEPVVEKEPVQAPEGMSLPSPTQSNIDPAITELEELRESRKQTSQLGKEQAQATLDLGEAEAKQELAKADVLKEANQALLQDEAKMQQVTQNNINRAEVKLRNLEKMNQSIFNGKVDPERYLKGMPTSEKVLTNIGIMLAGLGGDASKAIAVLDKRIDNDIKSQLADMENKQRAGSLQDSLLGKYLQILDDQKAAVAATKATTLQIYKNKLDQVSATTQSDITRAKAAELAKKIEAAAHAKDIEQSDAVRRKAQDVSSKDISFIVPGALTKTQGEGTKIREEFGDYLTAINTSSRMKDILKNKWQSLNPIAKSEYKALESSYIGQLRKVVLGGGPLTESERNYLNELLGAGGDLTSILGDPKARASINTMLETQRNQLINKLRSQGIDLNRIPKYLKEPQDQRKILPK